MKPFILFLFLSVFFGCVVQDRRSEASIDRRGRPQVTQKGEVKQPATATVKTSSTVLAIPAGSQVIVSAADTSATDARHEAAQAVSIITSQPTELRTETRTEAVEGAKTPEPPPPPSPVEIARGKGVVLFYWVAAACALVSVIFFWRGYPWAGVCFGAGAAVLALGVNVVSSEWVIRAAGGLAVAGVVFVVAWKIIAFRHGLTPQNTKPAAEPSPQILPNAMQVAR